MKRLSMVEEKIIGDLYQEILMESMAEASVMGPTIIPTIGKLVNDDTYATGDNRIPKLIGKNILTRKGALKSRKRRKKRRTRKTRDFNTRTRGLYLSSLGML